MRHLHGWFRLRMQYLMMCVHVIIKITSPIIASMVSGFMRLGIDGLTDGFIKRGVF